MEIVEVVDEKTKESMSDVEAEAVRKKEGDRILVHIRPDTFVITLEIEGRMLASEAFAQQIDDLATYGKRDRKSTRLNSSHVAISYAVFCLKKKKTQDIGKEDNE